MSNWQKVFPLVGLCVAHGSQWEYACRAGTTTAYSWGDTISATDANWKYSNDVNSTTEVGSFLANPWGFHDMHGNVVEICGLVWSISIWVHHRSYRARKWNGKYNAVVLGERQSPGYMSDRMRFKNPVDFQQNNIGFRLALRDLNKAPTDLNSLVTLAFEENQPIGTVIGEFNATDPDENSTITYHFVNGENNNSFFTLDTNGTLKTATIFDYESNASNYTITVQAKDELNATTEGTTVTLLMCMKIPMGMDSGTPWKPQPEVI